MFRGTTNQGKVRPRSWWGPAVAQPAGPAEVPPASLKRWAGLFLAVGWPLAPVRTLGGITSLDSLVLTPRVCPVPDVLWLSAGVLLPPLSSSQPWAPGPGPAGPVAAVLWPVSVPRCCDVLHPSAVRELYP